RVRVPERVHEQPYALAHALHREAVAVPRLLGGEEVPAEGVGPEAVEHIPRRHDVAAALRHLLTLLVEDQSEAEAGLVGRAAPEQRRDGEQRVEPAARLIDGLADVVRREALLEHALV